MGGLLSYFWSDAANLDEVDPALGLTQRQKNSVTGSWALVTKDIRQNGIDLLLAFFTAHPDYVKNFKAFKDVPLDKLENNKKFQAHANAVMYALTSIVDNLGSPEVLVEMLLKLGENHGNRNILEKEFNNLKTVTLIFLKDKLGSKFTPYVENAWEKTIDVAWSVIFKGIKQACKEKAIIS